MKINISRALIFLLAIFVLSIFLFSLNKIKIYDTKNLVGQNINTFELKYLDSEEKINEKLLKNNKFTLINFWASWCAPCRDEHPFLLKLKDENNLSLLGVNFKDKKNNALKFLNNFGNPYDYLTKDELGKHSVNFGVYGIPESILLNKNFVILKKFIGPLNKNDYDYIKEKIGKL